MGMLSFTYLERWTKEYLMNRGIFLLFSGNEGSPKGPLGSLMVLNRQTTVPWEVEIEYSTMGWFHLGNTERYLLERWSRNIWWFEAFFYVFRLWRALLGPPRVPNGSQWANQCSLKIQIKYSTMGWFQHGNTERYSLERWTKGYLMIWGVLFPVFSHWRAP